MLFMQGFRPITVELPRVLIPLVNTPMINYALEWLATNGVEEVEWLTQVLQCQLLCIVLVLEATISKTQTSHGKQLQWQASSELSLRSHLQKIEEHLDVPGLN